MSKQRPVFPWDSPLCNMIAIRSQNYMEAAGGIACIKKWPLLVNKTLAEHAKGLWGLLCDAHDSDSIVRRPIKVPEVFSRLIACSCMSVYTYLLVQCIALDWAFQDCKMLHDSHSFIASEVKAECLLCWNSPIRTLALLSLTYVHWHCWAWIKGKLCHGQMQKPVMLPLCLMSRGGPAKIHNSNQSRLENI